jgi:hypothetical protein
MIRIQYYSKITSDDSTTFFIVFPNIFQSSSDQLQNWNSWPEEQYREPTVTDRIEAYRASLKQVTRLLTLTQLEI